MSDERTCNETGETNPGAPAPERPETAARPGGGASPEPAADWAEQRLRRLDELLDKVEAKLQAQNFRPSVGDFVRLLQLRREFEDERPREITVTWVEPSEDESASVE